MILNRCCYGHTYIEALTNVITQRHSINTMEIIRITLIVIITLGHLQDDLFSFYFQDMCMTVVPKAEIATPIIKHVMDSPRLSAQ